MNTKTLDNSEASRIIRRTAKCDHTRQALYSVSQKKQGTFSPYLRKIFIHYILIRRLIHRPQTKTGSVWSRRQTSKWCTGKPDPSNLYQDEGWWPALAGVQTCQWSTTHHRDPPDLSCVTATEALQLAEDGPFWRTIATAGGFGWSLRVTTTTTTIYSFTYWADELSSACNTWPEVT